MDAAVERIWLGAYPPGTPHDIDPDAYASIAAVFDAAIAEYAALPAFTCMGRTFSFAELDRLSLAFAAFLQSSCKLKPGERVAIMMPNVLQYPVALFGILRAGLVVVNCNPLYTPRELAHQLADSDARAIVVMENFAATLQQVIGGTGVRHVLTTQMGDLLGFPKSALVNWVVKHRRKLVPAWSLPGSMPFAEALAIGSRAPFARPALGGDNLAFLQYTGGTTGVSKGAMLTHRNIVANMEQVSAWMDGHLTRAEEVVVQPLPLYHIFALTSCLVHMKSGCETVLVPNPRDIDGFVRLLASREWTVLTGVNTLFNGLLNHPGFAKIDFRPMKLSLGGGMAVQRAVAERWKAVTGKPLVEAYGLTETSPGACINPLTLADFNGCIGLPISSTVMTIRDDDGNLLPAGTPGEICIKGPQVMKGYWQRQDETDRVMTRDGAFKTGDIGIMESSGYFRIVDRKKDMILVSGFNVYPNEIEDVATACPGVREACAVAAPDEKSGEAVRLVVVRQDPSLTRERVLAHCRAHLTGYKVPRIVEFWDDLPKTNVGKVLRREVKAIPPRVAAAAEVAA